MKKQKKHIAEPATLEEVMKAYGMKKKDYEKLKKSVHMRMWMRETGHNRKT